MYQIYIDTSDRNIKKVQLLKDGEMFDELSGDIDVVSSIRNILEKNSLKISDIGEFKMNEGPGSFTGLKAGAAVVNALNWSVVKKDPKDIITPKYQPSKFD